MTADATSSTRRLIESFLTARASGDHAVVARCLADDVDLEPPVSTGFGPFQGRDAVVEALAGSVVGEVLDVSSIQRTLHRVLADGDMGVVLNRMEATTLNGEPYTNEYCFVFTCADGAITRIQEFADTLLANAVFNFAALGDRPERRRPGHGSGGEE